MSEGLGFEPATAVDHLRACDEILARIIDSIGPFRLQPISQITSSNISTE